MKMVKYISLSLLSLVFLVALAFTFKLGGLEWKKFFAPKEENIKREVFKSTRSYNEGKTQDLARYRHQYEIGNAEEKEAISSTIRIMFADYDRELLPNELSSFLFKIRGY